MATYKEFLTNFRLTENPFASFTTENEDRLFAKTFIKPNDYESILESFSQKNSILLTGDRGTGKTALIKDFINQLNSDESVVVQITDFSKLKQDYQLQDFYKFVIENLSISLFSNLTDKKKKIKKLNKEEKLLLCYLLKSFVPQIAKSQLKEKITNIQISYWKKNYKRIENCVRGLFNLTATVSNVLIDDFIARHFTGLPPISESIKIKDYFPELPINIEEEFITQEASYNLLLRIVSLSKKMDFDRVLLVFDKIDEDERFKNDAEVISEFIVKVLTDNKFLLEKDLQVVFSTWLTPFNFIKDQVRTQKHYCPTLSWRVEDLIKALNQRLKAYSNNKIADYKILFYETVTEEEINQILNIANRNPRDLWHIFNALFNVQHDLDSSSNKITNEAIPKALTKFVCEFNFYEYYPRKSNARSNTMDIYAYTKHLLKLDSEIFTKNQLNTKAQTGSSTNNYVVSMEKIGLVGIDRQEGGVVYYKIKDPKIIYAQKNKLEISKD